MSLKMMLVPSASCPARCRYCFGPRGEGAVMDERILNATVGWIDDLKSSLDKLDIIFHGGEPLTAGIDFYRRALPRLRQSLKTKRPRLNMQSNLWLLTDEFCEMFAEYGVSLGTSLDGPEEITDNQRGRGYFRRTMAGIELARSHGLRIGWFEARVRHLLHSSSPGSSNRSLVSLTGGLRQPAGASAGLLSLKSSEDPHQHP